MALRENSGEVILLAGPTKPSRSCSMSPGPAGGLFGSPDHRWISPIAAGAKADPCQSARSRLCLRPCR